MSGHADGGARRRQVLEAIYRSPAPLGASEIAGQVGIHPNTARFHLAALMAEGVIERTVAEPSGRAARAPSTGRAPGWRSVAERRYRILAEILLGCFTGTASGHAAADAGHAWGERVIGRAAPFQQVSQAEAVSRVLLLLDELAFAPETPAAGRPAGPGAAAALPVPGARRAPPRHHLPAAPRPDPGGVRRAGLTRDRHRAHPVRRARRLRRPPRPGFPDTGGAASPSGDVHRCTRRYRS